MSPLWPSYISEERLFDLIDCALQEDLGSGDVTTQATVAPETMSHGYFVAKDDGVIAGLQVAERIMHRFDASLTISWEGRDGAPVDRGTRFGRIRGRATSILSTERVTLNILQRMSGIASTTARFVDAVRGHQAKILDTRKTVPGMRILDKWAVLLGGGGNHRLGLFDMILIKDNHIAAAGGVAPAIRAARTFAAGRNLKVEVEARTLEEVDTILAEKGVDVILLDNMVDMRAEGRVDVSRLRHAVDLIDKRVLTEASGNVTLETVGDIASTGVDFISSGALTHSVSALDISLELEVAR